MKEAAADPEPSSPTTIASASARLNAARRRASSEDASEAPRRSMAPSFAGEGFSPQTNGRTHASDARVPSSPTPEGAGGAGGLGGVGGGEIMSQGIDPSLSYWFSDESDSASESDESASDE